MPRPLLSLAFVLLAPAIAAAQGFVAVKAGANIERAEDNLRGTTLGGGALAGYHWSDRWAIEGEFWTARALRPSPGEHRHRDTLFSAAMRRSFGAGRARPHVLVGLSVARTEDEFVTCGALRPFPGSPGPVLVLVSCDEPDVTERAKERFAGTSLYALAGAGVTIDVTRRLQLTADVRVQPWITSLIVRPALALGIRF